MDISQLWNIYKRISYIRPMVHCITNPVTINDCANALLAVGARAIMASHPDEMEDIQQGAGALVLNFGAIANLGSMRRAAECARRMGHPVIADPVGVSASTIRRHACIDLLGQGLINCVRGNASEISALLLDSRTATGLESEVSSDDLASCAVSLARRFSCTVVQSGAVDIITDGSSAWAVSNGDPLMGRITGAGCMSTTLIGAFYAADFSPLAAVASCAAYGICGEIAAGMTRAQGRGTGTFRTLLMDGLYLLSEEDFKDRAKVELL